MQNIGLFTVFPFLFLSELLSQTKFTDLITDFYKIGIGLSIFEPAYYATQD